MNKTQNPRKVPQAERLEGAVWRKSSFSAGENDCVEVADMRATSYSGIAVRDSKAPNGPALMLTPEAFISFVAEACDPRWEA